MRFNYFRLLFLLLFFVQDLAASHVIGGEVTYECLGNGRYLIEYILYRDCREGNADFDDRGILTYFICTENGSCSGKVQDDGKVMQVPLENRSFVNPPELECLVNSVDICVEKATYTFEIDGFNPMVDSSYIVVFQRCCRNETIINIENPGNSGSSYLAEIFPQSQASCNSSPVFKNFPPTIICANEPINFDHSAVDPDGDSLVYSFCSPLLGGGVAGDANSDPFGDPSACDGVAPAPGCPNFDNEVNFIRPLYSAEQPMAGNPVVSIDSLTGLITGIPDIQGQFVVGVCVAEYRNGEFLGTIQRDFQFNVAECIQNVTALIESDEVIENREPNGELISRDFLITYCGQESLEFINESFDRTFISEIRWEFEEGTILSDDWNAVVDFPGEGDYEGKLFLNPNSPQCIDSANIFVTILPELRAGFSTDFDKCDIGPVTFTDSSFAAASTITNWQWDFDDGNNSAQRNPIHQYNNVGEFSIELTVIDDNGCVDSEIRTINYSPVPQSISIDQNRNDGCNPTPIIFTNNSSPIGEEYNILWNFGDGNTSTEISPTHVYETPGVYSVSLSIETPTGCEIAENYQDIISILPSPTAGFTLFPEELTSTNPTVQVTDASVNANNWLYLFDNQGTATAPNPSFTFTGIDTQQVVQIITAENGCRDTAVQLIDIIPFVDWYMPNAFTPTRDGINDIFIGDGFLEGANNFNFTIWNRWGELIFETNDYTQGWNGRKNNTDRDSPAGVYIYVLSYFTPRGKKVQLEGFATLIR